MYSLAVVHKSQAVLSTFGFAVFEVKWLKSIGNGYGDARSNPRRIFFCISHALIPSGNVSIFHSAIVK